MNDEISEIEEKHDKAMRNFMLRQKDENNKH